MYVYFSEIPTVYFFSDFKDSLVLKTFSIVYVLFALAKSCRVCDK